MSDCFPITPSTPQLICSSGWVSLFGWQKELNCPFMRGVRFKHVYQLPKFSKNHYEANNEFDVRDGCGFRHWRFVRERRSL